MIENRNEIEEKEMKCSLLRENVGDWDLIIINDR